MSRKIIIKNLRIFAYHGVHDFEKRDGQAFFFDVLVDFPEGEAPISDEISSVVSYSEIIRQIKKTVTEKSYNLIETVAERVILDLFSAFGEITALDVTVKKPEAPLSEEFDFVGVRISKKRGEV